MEIKKYTTLLWHWAWLIVLGTIVAGGTAYIVNKNTTPVYRSSSRLLIDEAPGSAAGNEYSQILLEQRLALTYVEILKTEPVIQETIDRLNLPFSSGQLSAKVSVSAPQDTQIIIISVEDTEPERAALIANTLGQVFTDQNSDRESLRYADPIANWQDRVDETADEIQSLETQINELGAAETSEARASLSRLQTQLNGAQIRYTEAFNNLNELQVEQAKESSNVLQIEPAKANFTPVRPRTFTNTLLAAIVGGMAAIGVVFLVEYLDDSITTPEQIIEDTALSTLGTIAIIKGDTPSSRIVAHNTPRAPVSEAYRVLRTNLSYSAVDGGLRSLLISSASAGEGKSTTAANLGIVMAQTGKRVMLVDADLRRPVQHKIFGVQNNQGLTTAILDKQTPLDFHVQKTQIPNLNLLPSGPIPPNPAELLNSQRMAELLETLKETSDLIIFDSPPILTVADATILAPQVTGALLVVEIGRTKRNFLIQAVERLHNSNATVFGTVLNRLNPSRSGYYYNYYYHYYNSYDYNQRKRPGGSQRKVPGWLTGLIRR